MSEYFLRADGMSFPLEAQVTFASLACSLSCFHSVMRLRSRLGPVLWKSADTFTLSNFEFAVSRLAVCVCVFVY